MSILSIVGTLEILQVIGLLATLGSVISAWRLHRAVRGSDRKDGDEASRS